MDIATLAINAALFAGSILKEGFYTHKGYKISSKKDGIQNLVTEYDYLSEKAIISLIKKEFPTHSILSEECGSKKKKSDIDVEWIIDPLDGTVNFAHKIPHFCVSIAVKIKKKVTIGVVYQPITNELFFAEYQKGSFLNGKQLSVSKTKKLKDAFMFIGFPYKVAENPKDVITITSKFLKLGVPLRRLGTAAIDLSYVADGRADGYCEVNLKPWDYAAGNLILQEAGGKISTWDGFADKDDITKDINYEKEGILASNGRIHDELLIITKGK